MSKKLEFLLKATDFPEDSLLGSIGWVDSVTPLNEFFSWMDDCISERNCITSGELRMHEILDEDGKFLEEEDEKIVDLADKFNYEFPGNLRAYPAVDDLEVLAKIREAKERQLSHLKNYDREIKKNTPLAASNLVLQRVTELFDAEVNRVHSLTSGDYKKSLNELSSSFDKLLKSLKYVQENGCTTSSVFSADVDTFFELLKLLKIYVSNYVTLSKLEEGNPKPRKSLRDRFSSDTELERIFNESINASTLIVKKQAELSSVSAVMNLLNSGDVLSAALNINKNYDKPSDDDLAEKCYENVKQFVRLNQVKMIEQARTRRREILPDLRQNAEKAKILKLCGEATIFLAQQDRKWAKISLTLVSDCHSAIEEILSQTQQCHRGLNNLQTTLELSVVSPEQSFLPLCGHSTPNVFKMCSDISIDDQPNLISNVLEDFIKKLRKRLLFGKELYNHIFDGPCAKLRSDDEEIAKILRAKERLKMAWEDAKELDRRHYKIKVSRFNNASDRIKEWLGFVYIHSPTKFFDLEKNIEEETRHQNQDEGLDFLHDNGGIIL